MRKSIIAVVFGLVALPALAYAESFDANVTSVDPAANTVTVSPTEKTDKLPSTLTVAVKEDAKFKNAATLADVKTGDHVKINAKENKDTGVWEGKSVEVKVGDEGANATPPTP